jgi:hypothetical protein
MRVRKFRVVEELLQLYLRIAYVYAKSFVQRSSSHQMMETYLASLNIHKTICGRTRVQHCIS